MSIGVALTVALFAIGTPKMRRAWIASNEAAAIADTQAVIDAEYAFASMNCGYFVEPVSLCNSGGDCDGIPIPGYTGPDFLGPELGRRSPFPKDGYVRTWVPTGAVPTHRSSCQTAPTSVSDYCYLATPVRLGWTGNLYLAGGAIGAVYGQRDKPFTCPIVPPFTCVVEGTLVATPEGAVPIESLRAGDEVLGGEAGKEKAGTVVATRRNSVVSHLLLTFEGGRTLAVTDVHPISTPDGWRVAGTLLPGHVVHERGGRAILERVDVVPGEVVVYDLTVEPTGTFFANGILVHNKTE